MCPACCSQGFFFATRPGLQFGLVQKEGGPCGLLAAVQAHILSVLSRPVGDGCEVYALRLVQPCPVCHVGVWVLFRQADSLCSVMGCKLCESCDSDMLKVLKGVGALPC